MRRHIHSYLLVISIAVVAAASTLVSSTPSVDRLKKHVSYLASEKLEGRRTGTPGAELAAKYIGEEFKRYGLRPPAKVEGKSRAALANYQQPFPYVSKVELGRKNSMRVTNRAGASGSSFDLKLGEDWTPAAISTNERVADAPVAFVGYGIAAPDLNYDSYAGIDVKGAVVIALSDFPDADNPHSQFGRYSNARWKAIAARDRGAKALLVVSGSNSLQQDRLSRLTYDNTGGDAGIPVMALSRSTAANLLSFGGVGVLEDLERSLKETSSQGSSKSHASSERVTGYLKKITVDITTELLKQKASATNVIGILEGSDPKLKHETVVIGAHYDHLGRGGAGSLAGRDGDIHFGADDNASGVAALLELARTFAARRQMLKRTLVFIAFGGEEEGLLGSNFYANNPAIPLERTVAMINLDMVGRLRDNRLMISGVGTASEWREWIKAANLAAGVRITAGGDSRGSSQDVTTIAVGSDGKPFVVLDPASQFDLRLSEDGYGPSDHSSFYTKKVPVLFFWTGTHTDYHKPSDTAEKINYEGLARIAAFAARIVDSIDASDQRPNFVQVKSEPSQRTVGFRVYLGTIPSYAESTEGLKLDAVREGSPAEKAGLKAGDVIVRLAGREVRNVYDYTNALGEMKPGQEYEVELLREGQRLKLNIVPAEPRR